MFLTPGDRSDGDDQVAQPVDHIQHQLAVDLTGCHVWLRHPSTDIAVAQVILSQQLQINPGTPSSLLPVRDR